MSLILEGIRVIDLTQYQMGSVATQVLADMGAEVIKVERPDGEPGRRIGPFTSRGVSAYFQAHNRNKKSVVIDLKHGKGKEVFFNLVERADVIAENFQRGVPEKLGIDYETVADVNSKLIYFTGSAFGLEGPMSKNLGFDSVGQAMGGLISTIWTPLGQPNALIGCPIVDQTGGFLGALGIVMALFHRERTGEGQRVDVSLLGTGVALLNWVLQAFLVSGSIPGSKTRARINMAGISSTHVAGDRKPLVIQVMKNRLETALRILGLESFLADSRFKFENMDRYADEVLMILDEAFSKKDREYWLHSFASAGIVAAPILDCEEVSQHPQVLANKYVTDLFHPREGMMKVLGFPVHFSKTPNLLGGAPELGEHTDSVLAELVGYSPAEIAELRQLGAIR